MPEPPFHGCSRGGCGALRPGAEGGDSSHAGSGLPQGDTGGPDAAREPGWPGGKAAWAPTGRGEDGSPVLRQPHGFMWTDARSESWAFCSLLPRSGDVRSWKRRKARREVWKKSVRTGEGKTGRFHSCPGLAGSRRCALSTRVFSFPSAGRSGRFPHVPGAQAAAAARLFFPAHLEEEEKTP